MSNLKINEHQYLSEVEMRRLVKYLGEEGYIRLLNRISSGQFGVIDSVSDTSFSNLYCFRGTNPGSVTVTAGNAFDSLGNYINLPQNEVDFYSSPSDSVLRYIVIRYATTSLETGTVSIAANGVVTGLSTEFTEYLRGQGNVPIKVSFPNSVSNTGEYSVVSVTNDTTMQLAAPVNFVVESGQEISVVGAFTPGIPIPAGSKNIYEIDSYELLDTTTPLANDVILCSVIWDGIDDATITDLRQQNRLSLGALLNDSEVVQGNFTETHPFIGVEQIMNGSIITDILKIKIGFGYRVAPSTWTVGKKDKIITFSSGTGGTFLNTITGITNNYFAGWYAYVLDSTTESVIFKSKIVSNTSGASVQLTLREFPGLDPDVSATLVIAPDCDFIEVFVEEEYVSVLQNTTQTRIFRPEEGFAFIEANYPLTSEELKVSYRMVKGKRATSRKVVNNGNYYNTNQFSYPNGTLLGGATLTASLNGLYGPSKKTSTRLVDMKDGITLTNGWVAFSSGTYGVPSSYYDRINGIIRLTGILDGSAATGSVASSSIVSSTVKPESGVNHAFNVQTFGNASKTVSSFIDNQARLNINGFGSANDIYAISHIWWVVPKNIFNI